MFVTFFCPLFHLFDPPALDTFGAFLFINAFDLLLVVVMFYTMVGGFLLSGPNFVVNFWMDCRVHTETFVYDGKCSEVSTDLPYYASTKGPNTHLDVHSGAKCSRFFIVTGAN